jgi:hypothetical protein
MVAPKPVRFISLHKEPAGYVVMVTYQDYSGDLWTRQDLRSATEIVKDLAAAQVNYTSPA